jgi:CHAT domain-containing protein
VATITTWTISRSPCVLSRAEPAPRLATTGEAFIGLSWALDVAGCPTQIISRWSAESVATPGLMAEVHRLLGRTTGGASAERGDPALEVAEALRRAQLAVLKNPARQEPWFWAGFLVMGIAERVGPDGLQ